MSLEQDKVREVFGEALDRTMPEERERFLAEVAARDPELRRQVDSLLLAHGGAGDFLRQNVIQGAPIGEVPGNRIGRYKLLQQIGEGGFGVVFMAEQQEPVRRLVALKIIKAGMDTREVVARFEAERQALALMDHPNIARVLDGGATESGRPYFVMDLVKGIPLTEFCDHHQLPTEARLRLFIQVCAALQHAHQKGVIHRDLKPSNVLVTLHDGEPVPKVIDFGISKAIGQRLTDKTLFTRFEQLIGTPAYMSPEQAEWSGLDIDTRSDIYSLGVLLYELLTGTTPLEKDTLARAAFDEIRRIIRETEPPNPSTRLNALVAADVRTSKSKTLPQGGTKSEMDSASLRRRLQEVRGDLDWIVMKSLEKDRTRRYETVNELAVDIRRHLDNEPVAACPPSNFYRFQKLARRHRVALTTACAFALLFVFGFVGVLWQWQRANFNARAEANQRRRAEANFLNAREAVDRMLTGVAEELNAVPHMEQIRRKLLEDALKFHRDFLKEKGNDPAVRRDAALTYLRVGNIYDELGQYDKSLETFGQALTMLEDLAKRHPAEGRYREGVADAHNGMAYATFSLRRFDESIAHRREQLAWSERLHREFPTVSEYLRKAAYAHVDLGNALKADDRSNEAVEELRQALQLCEKQRTDLSNLIEDRALLAKIHHWLGAALNDIGQSEEAERQYRESHNLRRQLVAEQPHNVKLKPGLGHIKAYLADLLMNTKRPGEAAELLQQAVAIDEELLRDFPNVQEYRRRAGIDYQSLSSVFSPLRRTQEAEAALRRSLAIREKLVADLPGLPRNINDLTWNYYNLGVILEATGQSEEGAKDFRQAITIVEKLTAEYPQTPLYQAQLGWMLATCPAIQFRNPQRAVTLVKQALQRKADSALYWTWLGFAHYYAGDLAAAIESFHESMGLARGGDGRQWLGLAMAHCQKGNLQEARKWYDNAVDWIEKNRSADQDLARLRAEAAGLLGDHATAQDKDNKPHAKEASP